MTESNLKFNEIQIERLGPTDTIDKTFESSDPEFTDYYKVQSQYDLKEGLAITYVLKVDKKVFGYVSVAMAYLKKETTVKTDAKETDGNIPALLLSHLSVHKDHQREQIGTRLIDVALSIAIKYSKYIGCRYLMLNPIDDEGVKKFYESYGFEFVINKKGEKESDIFIFDIQ